MRIAIIGSGPAGIAAGRELLQQGFSDFTIFDVNDCDERVSDSQGNEMTMKSAFEPRMVISGAKTFLAERTKTHQSNS